MSFLDIGYVIAQLVDVLKCRLDNPHFVTGFWRISPNVTFYNSKLIFINKMRNGNFQST